MFRTKAKEAPINNGIMGFRTVPKIPRIKGKCFKAHANKIAEKIM